MIQYKNNFYENTTAKYLNNTKTNTEKIENLLKSLNLYENKELSTTDIVKIFKLNEQYNGLFSSNQLLDVDYNFFRNHVFFDSAVSKVDYCFERILSYPYDKTYLEFIDFKNKNSGYVDYILKNEFPKSTGSLVLNGDNIVIVYDTQGKILNDYNKKEKKLGILNPRLGNFSIEFNYKIKEENALDLNQVLFYKKSNVQNSEEGYMCYICPDNSDVLFCKLKFLISVKGSVKISSIKIRKNYIYHNLVIDINNLNKNMMKTSFIVDGIKIQDKFVTIEEDNLSILEFSNDLSDNNTPFIIGGSYDINQNTFLHKVFNVDVNNFIGEIDELRFFGLNRNIDQIKNNINTNIYAQKGLSLYLKFNEPSGSYTNAALCVDSSGNKIHGIILVKDEVDQTYSIPVDTSSYKNNLTSLTLEKLEENPVLNLNYPLISEKRNKIYEKAKEFDSKNPNIIFKLLPAHYFIESSNFQNLPIYNNNIESFVLPESFSNESGQLENPSQLKINQTKNNDLSNIVLIWARFFDQLKVQMKSIESILNIDYDSLNQNKIASVYLPLMCQLYGFEFEEIFDSITQKKINNQNLVYEDVVNDLSIRAIQNKLWQKFLINTQDFLKSKGTQHAIKSAFSSFGIDYSKLIDIKEHTSYFDLSNKNLFVVEDKKVNYLSFDNLINLRNDPSYEDLAQYIFSSNKQILEISDIRRRENIQNDIQNSVNTHIQGLGKNWTLETFFGFNDFVEKYQEIKNSVKIKSISVINENKYKSIQNIFRINTQNNPCLSVYFIKENQDSVMGKINVKIQPLIDNSNYLVDEYIENISIFDAIKYFSISQKINENSITYKICISNAEDCHVLTPDFTKEIILNITDLNTKISTDKLCFYNNENTFAIGNFNYPVNSNILGDDNFVIQNTSFEGQIYAVRAWQKDLSDSEIHSHKFDMHNIGVEEFEPSKDLVFNFSFLDFYEENFVDTNNQYEMSIIDQSDNAVLINNQITNVNTCIVKTKNQDYLNQKIIRQKVARLRSKMKSIDNLFYSNRVNIHSFKEEQNKQTTENIRSFPSNTVPKEFYYDDTSKISIEMSIVKVLNEDISKIIFDLESFTSLLSKNMSIHSYSYKSLEEIRSKYFEKFDDKKYIKYSSIGGIFKYFDNILTNILQDIIPAGTQYDGFNFVYESHTLERHKYEHKNKYSKISLSPDFEEKHSYSRHKNNNRRPFLYNSNRSSDT
jgi:hypothetical protein